MFSSLLQIALWANVRMLNGKTRKRDVCFAGVLTAFATNSRFYCLFLFACVICLLFLESSTSENTEITKRSRLACLVFAVSFFISIIIITPASWSNPFKFMVGYVDKFFGYDPWQGAVTFMGQNILKQELPRYYFAVWLLISIPLVYLFYFFIGSGAFISQILREKKERTLLINKKFIVIISICAALFLFFCCSLLIEGLQTLDGIFFFFAILFLVATIYFVTVKVVVKNKVRLLIFVLFFAPLVATIFRKGLLYNWWRHLYFTFPFLAIIAVHGICVLLRIIKKPVVRFLIPTSVIITLFLQTAWMVKNHPYQNMFLNIIGKPFGADFDRDVWGLSDYQMLKWLYQTMPDEEIFMVTSRHTPLHLMVLDEVQRERFVHTDAEHAEYIIDNLGGIIGNDNNVDGFTEIHSIWVDGYKIGSILRRKR
jgi:hypothetical protein